MKYLGIDFGTKRIGIATSDDAGDFAFPKRILENDSKAIGAIVELTKEENIAAVVIGYSIASNSRENEVADAAQRFREKLGHSIDADIYMEREDFSSFEAHRYQTEAGPRDDSAAAIILQRFLDKKRKIV